MDQQTDQDGPRGIPVLIAVSQHPHSGMTLVELMIFWSASKGAHGGAPRTVMVRICDEICVNSAICQDQLCRIRDSCCLCLSWLYLFFLSVNSWVNGGVRQSELSLMVFLCIVVAVLGAFASLTPARD